MKKILNQRFLFDDNRSSMIEYDDGTSRITLVNDKEKPFAYLDQNPQGQRHVTVNSENDIVFANAPTDEDKMVRVTKMMVLIDLTEDINIASIVFENKDDNTETSRTLKFALLNAQMKIKKIRGNTTKGDQPG